MKRIQPRKSLVQLCRRGKELGALESKAIDTATIAVAEWVRYKCQFGCEGFGERLTCPPYSPTPDETRTILRAYGRAILIHCKSGSRADISGIILKLETEAFLAGYYKALGMGAGPCRLCGSCDVKKTCRHGDKARPSMEACGIDVYATARKNGYAIDTLDSYRCRADYFGLVLID